MIFNDDAITNQYFNLFNDPSITKYSKYSNATRSQKANAKGQGIV